MITRLLAPELIVAELGSSTVQDALARLTGAIAKRNPDIDGDALLFVLAAREREAATALGDGVAIPHGRVLGLRRMLAAFGRSLRGIEWQAPDGRPVHLVMLLAAPAEFTGGFLKTLACAATLLRDPQCRLRLMSAATSEEILEILHDEEARHGDTAT